MGDFRIVIEGSGPHGCDRQSGDMDQVYGCGSMSCPDCQARAFLKTLRDSTSTNVSKAEIIHWPADFKNEDGTPRYTKEGEVRDDLLTRIRIGTFPEHSSKKR
jgi:hypothetical protein